MCIRDSIYAFVYNDFLCQTQERAVVMTKPCLLYTSFLLKQGWQTMDDPVNPGQKLIYCDNQLKDYKQGK